MTLRLFPLGRPHYRVDGDRRRRPLRGAPGAFLLMLALDRQVTREELRATLWPDLPHDEAEAELDRMLPDLGTELGDTWLITEGDALVATDELQVDEGNLPLNAAERRPTPERRALLDKIRTMSEQPDRRIWGRRGDSTGDRRTPEQARTRNPWMTLLLELRRRHVLHVAAVYLVGAWAAIETTSTIFPLTRLPAAAPNVVLALTIAGFPVALALAWAFDLTDEGYRRAAPTPANLFRALWSNPAARRWTLVAAAATPAFVIGAWLLVRPGGPNQNGTAAASRSDLPPPSRIAVLYFHAMGADPQLRGIAAGVTEALIHELNLVPALKVTPSNGVRPFRDSSVSGDSIARVLGVGTIVDGSLMQLGDSLRLNVELSDPGQGTVLDSWAEAAPSSFALINEVIEHIAISLRQSLGRQVDVTRWHSGTSNQQAWNLMRTALDQEEGAEKFQNTGYPEAAARTLLWTDTLLQHITGMDPDWPDPVLERGRVARHLYFIYFPLGDLAAVRAWMDSAEARAESVLDRDSKNAAALELLGQVLQEKSTFIPPPTQEARDSLVAAAETDVREAVDLDDGRAVAWAVLSRILFAKGALAEAHRAAEQAYRADAYLEQSQQILDRLFQTSFELKQDSAASAWCAEQGRRFPRDWLVARCRLMLMIWSRRSMPDPTTAWALLDSLPTTNVVADAMPRLKLLVAGVLIRADLPDSARAVIDRVTHDPPDSPEYLHYEAADLLLLDDRRIALDLLHRYVQSVPGGEIVLMSRRFDALRGDPWLDSLRTSSATSDH